MCLCFIWLDSPYPLGIPDSCSDSFLEGNCPVTHHLATATMFQAMIPLSILKSPFMPVVFRHWPQKPCRNVPTSLILGEATWLAKQRLPLPLVSAGAVARKQPPPANVCTCLWLTGNLLSDNQPSDILRLKGKGLGAIGRLWVWAFLEQRNHWVP